MSDSREKPSSHIHKLQQWFRTRIIQDVPDNFEACVFECHKSECAMGDWEKCQIRLQHKPQARGQD